MISKSTCSVFIRLKLQWESSISNKKSKYYNVCCCTPVWTKKSSKKVCFQMFAFSVVEIAFNRTATKSTSYFQSSAKTTTRKRTQLKYQGLWCWQLKTLAFNKLKLLPFFVIVVVRCGSTSVKSIYNNFFFRQKRKLVRTLNLNSGY